MAVYTVEFENQTITTAGGDRDFFYIAPADDKPCILLAVFLDQISDVGDAAEEMLRYRIIRGHTTVGSGGAAATPSPVATAGTASFTARTNDTTIASLGTAVNIHSGAFNIRSGLQLMLPEYMQARATQAQGSLVIRLMGAPADDVVMSGTAYVEEVD